MISVVDERGKKQGRNEGVGLSWYCHHQCWQLLTEACLLFVVRFHCLLITLSFDLIVHFYVQNYSPPFSQSYSLSTKKKNTLYCYERFLRMLSHINLSFLSFFYSLNKISFWSPSFSSSSFDHWIIISYNKFCCFVFISFVFSAIHLILFCFFFPFMLFLSSFMVREAIRQPTRSDYLFLGWDKWSVICGKGLFLLATCCECWSICHLVSRSVVLFLFQ